MSNSEHHRNLGKETIQQKGLYIFHHKSLHFLYEPCGFLRTGTVRPLVNTEKVSGIGADHTGSERSIPQVSTQRVYRETEYAQAHPEAPTVLL